MDVGEHVGEIADERARLERIHRAAREHLGEVLSLHALDHEPRPSILEDARLVERRDARMLERGDDARLAKELHPQWLILGVHDLEHGAPGQDEVSDLVEHTGSRRTELALDLIRTETIAG
ncbi:MAG: hypothetical protein H6Q90_6710 [Deltaproteobacteria bacterium]|nr:hypothetical protein [Deltaproteobacteria bacterium]